MTGLEDHRLRQGLNELVDMEYLEVITGSTGRAYQYRLLHGPNTQAPASMRELTTPEELERLWLGRRK